MKERYNYLLTISGKEAEIMIRKISKSFYDCWTEKKILNLLTTYIFDTSKQRTLHEVIPRQGQFLANDFHQGIGATEWQSIMSNQNIDSFSAYEWSGGDTKLTVNLNEISDGGQENSSYSVQNILRSNTFFGVEERLYLNSKFFEKGTHYLFAKKNYYSERIFKKVSLAQEKKADKKKEITEDSELLLAQPFDLSRFGLRTISIMGKIYLTGVFYNSDYKKSEVQGNRICFETASASNLKPTGEAETHLLRTKEL